MYGELNVRLNIHSILLVHFTSFVIQESDLNGTFGDLQLFQIFKLKEIHYKFVFMTVLYQSIQSTVGTFSDMNTQLLQESRVQNICSESTLSCVF